MGRSSIAACALLTCLVSPLRARADACASRSTPRWIARTFVGLSIPLGAELQGRAGLCVPLRPENDEWLDLAALEIGAMTAISPAYAMGGGYVTMTPVNFLSFRLEVLGVGYWPIPVDGAGYYGLPRASTPRNATTLGAANGESASGSTVRGLMTLQAHVPIEGVAVLGRDIVSGERSEMGTEPYFINLNTGLTQRRSDVTVGNDVVLALEIPVPAGPSLRLGGYDSVRLAPSIGSLTHQIGGLFVVGWSRPIAEISWMEIGLRGGGYENASVEEGDTGSDVTLGALEFTIAAWTSIEWDLGGL